MAQRPVSVQAHFMRSLLLSTLLLAALLAMAPRCSARVLQEQKYDGVDKQSLDTYEDNEQGQTSSKGRSSWGWQHSADGSSDDFSDGSESSSDSSRSLYSRQEQRKAPSSTSSTTGTKWQRPSKYTSTTPTTTTTTTPTTTQQPAGSSSSVPASGSVTSDAPTSAPQPATPSVGSTQPATTTTTPTTPTTSTTAPNATQAGSGAPDAVLQAVLDLHNKLRARHGAPPLSWSNELYKGAQSWAEGCSHSHSMTDANWNKGESIAWGNRPFTTAVQQEWYDEEPKYDYNHPGYSDSTAHFTQLVWKSTTQLGCGVGKCSDGPFYVCNYLPPGNWNNAFAENVSPPTQR